MCVYCTLSGEVAEVAHAAGHLSGDIAAEQLQLLLNGHSAARGVVIVQTHRRIRRRRLARRVLNYAADVANFRGDLPIESSSLTSKPHILLLRFLIHHYNNECSYFIKKNSFQQKMLFDLSFKCSTYFQEQKKGSNKNHDQKSIIIGIFPFKF
jgi:hypothetical protein